MRIPVQIISLGLLAVVEAQEILPVTTTVQFTTAAIAAGASAATVIPFNVDFLGKYPDNLSQNAAWTTYDTSIWESRVAVYEGVDHFATFASLQWPNGEGPDAAPLELNKTWSACVIAFPDLFRQLNITSPASDGSCYDPFKGKAMCLSALTSWVNIWWQTSLRESRTLTPDAFAKACRKSIEYIPLDMCSFSSSSNSTIISDNLDIKAYPIHNPKNGQPFIVGIDKYDSASKDKKADVQSKVLSRTWPFLLFTSQGRTRLTLDILCPTAGNGYFSDNFDSGNLDSWWEFDGSFDASSKKLVAKSSNGGKATIRGMDFANFTYEADITFPAGAKNGNSGLVFRVRNLENGTNGYHGYHASLDIGLQSVILNRLNGSSIEIGKAQTTILLGQSNHVKIRALGDVVGVFVNDMDKPKISVKDSLYSNGRAGIRVFNTDTTFDNISIKPIGFNDSMIKIDPSTSSAMKSQSYHYTQLLLILGLLIFIG